MKTWRERIVEARARGWFTEYDRERAQDPCRCAVVETIEGTPLDANVVAVNFYGNDGSGDDWALMFMDYVLANKIDAAERLLDAIEDRVLQIKRERLDTTATQ